MRYRSLVALLDGSVLRISLNAGIRVGGMIEVNVIQFPKNEHFPIFLYSIPSRRKNVGIYPKTIFGVYFGWHMWLQRIGPGFIVMFSIPIVGECVR